MAQGQHTLFIQLVEQCAMGDTIECNMLKGVEQNREPFYLFNKLKGSCKTTTVVYMVGVKNLILTAISIEMLYSLLFLVCHEIII